MEKIMQVIGQVEEKSLSVMVDEEDKWIFLDVEDIDVYDYAGVCKMHEAFRAMADMYEEDAYPMEYYIDGWKISVAYASWEL